MISLGDQRDQGVIVFFFHLSRLRFRGAWLMAEGIEIVIIYLILQVFFLHLQFLLSNYQRLLKFFEHLARY